MLSAGKPAYADEELGTRRDTPAPELLETCWRMRGPSGKIVSCGISQTTDPGVEVQVAYPGDDVLRRQATKNMDGARKLAEDWKQFVLAKGGFEELAAEN
jgi:hypothetical protein